MTVLNRGQSAAAEGVAEAEDIEGETRQHTTRNRRSLNRPMDFVAGGRAAHRRRSRRPGKARERARHEQWFG